MADALIAIARAEGRKWYKLTPPTVVSTLELHSVMLDLVRREGDWEEWLAFLVEGIRVTAAGAVETAQRLATLFRDDRTKIESKGRRAGSALRVHEAIKAFDAGDLPHDRAVVSCGVVGHGFADGHGAGTRADRQAAQSTVRL